MWPIAIKPRLMPGLFSFTNGDSMFPAPPVRPLTPSNPPEEPCVDCLQGNHKGEDVCDPIMAAMGKRYRQAPGLASLSVSELEELVAHLDRIIGD